MSGRRPLTVSRTSLAPVPKPASPCAVKWTAPGTGLATDEGGRWVPEGGAGVSPWQAVSSNAIAIGAARANPDHLRCFDSPVMIPSITELSSHGTAPWAQADVREVTTYGSDGFVIGMTKLVISA